jgi:hypothetical protein
MGRVVARLNPVLEALGAAPYPFDHTQGDVSLAAFVTADMPPPHVDRSAYLAVGHVMARLTGLYSRALNRLAAIVYQVEQAVGVQLNAPIAFRNRTRKAARYIVVIASERSRAAWR